jgi:Mrp family chromosome partitioning ATPase
MTIFERKPNVVATTRVAGKSPRTLFRVATGPAGTVADASERVEQVSVDPESARRLTKVIASAQAQSASIIGITGPRTGIGVSVVSRELAGALASFGAKTLLVDVSHATVVEPSTEPVLETSLALLASEVRPRLSVAKVGVCLSADAFRASLAEAVREGYTVVLDLPPVMQASGQPTPSLLAAGAACDVVFLVSLSGQVTQKELVACIETGRLVGLKLGGMILNDWRMPASGLIES